VPTPGLLADLGVEPWTDGAGGGDGGRDGGGGWGVHGERRTAARGEGNVIWGGNGEGDDWGRKEGRRGLRLYRRVRGANGRPRSAAAGLRLSLDDWPDLLFLEEKEDAASWRG
jgi:hypothetical protein